MANIGPRALTDMVQSNSFSVMSAMAVRLPTPALLTRMSSAPKVSNVVEMRRRTSVILAMSAWIAAARPPLAKLVFDGGDGFGGLGGAVAMIDDDRSAGGGEGLGDGAADAAGGAGDDGDLSAREWERVGIFLDGCSRDSGCCKGQAQSLTPGQVGAQRC